MGQIKYTFEAIANRPKEQLNIDPITGEADVDLIEAQGLIYKYLLTPHGKGMATAQRMKFVTPYSEATEQRDMFFPIPK